MLPQFEMKLRFGDGARVADRADGLPLAHGIAAFDRHGVGVRIGAGPSVRMPDQNQVAKPRQAITGIGNRPICRCADRCAARRCYVDAIIVQTARFRTEVRQYPALGRQQEGRRGGGGR